MDAENIEYTAKGYTETTQGPIRHHVLKMSDGTKIECPVVLRVRKRNAQTIQVPVRGKVGYIFALPGGGRIEA